MGANLKNLPSTNSNRRVADRQSDRPSDVDPTPRPTRRRTDTAHASRLSPHTTASFATDEKSTTGWTAWFLEDRTIEKALMVFGFVIAITFILLFGIDLLTGWPFLQASPLFDLVYVICGTVLVFMSWQTYSELR